ncbi:STM4012 family radical SAM protein [Bailinhaonella thermotolerans]|uniref:Heme chaperone HemW n=1 Tax=Bailinhaonella thermotolerans TaxID=1070861 RepID=A0A3A4ANM2_9ACTN|nr:STM4012 family radical SAM protein [Bailinhaonella thermotolerans]RJL30149.1 coproporphyrinogen III oxidase family protein [Bailinhaonella thermotolerans]
MIRPYQGYVYAYPHKTAYRPLDPRPALDDVWAGEDTSALFLYLHIPFCEMRCGFCNLFTRTGAPEELTSAYLGALERQAEAVRRAVPAARFAAAAVGGGTPTYLTAPELTRLFDIAEGVMGADLRAAPLAVETSPATATPDRLAVLAERGTTRVSIGVQSFIDAEARAAVRPQRRAEVETALGHIRDAAIETLNIDLIYGIDGQDAASWRYSLDAALAWRPEEIYLYPLYVRPLTGLGRLGRDWDDQRLTLYREGRDHLLAAGYEQVSMRMFRLPRATPPASASPRSEPSASASAASAASASPVSASPGSGPAGPYRCQEDGMVGLGCGARSYTSGLHYSFEYAVGARHVRAIIDDYVRLPPGEFGVANVGFALGAEDRRRRHLIQSLLQAEGLDRLEYKERFGADALDDFAPDLSVFADRGWLAETADRLVLTPEGLAHSDAIGPALFSAHVNALMSAYEDR